MTRLYLTITRLQREEIKNYFLDNGFNVEWETDDVIAVSDEELEKVKDVLYEHYIPYSNGRSGVWANDLEIRPRVDFIYVLAREVLDKNNTTPTKDEEEILDNLLNIVNVYEKSKKIT